MTLYVSVLKQVIITDFNNNKKTTPFLIMNSKTDMNPQRVSSLELKGTIRLVYDPDNPLSGGMPCWVEIDPE